VRPPVLDERLPTILLGRVELHELDLVGAPRVLPGAGDAPELLVELAQPFEHVGALVPSLPRQRETIITEESGA